MRYAKRPVVVEATQWLGGAADAVRVLDWVLTSDFGTARYYEHVDGDPKKDRPANPEHLAIDTLEGTMRAVAGDWIIKGIKGEFYPCKPDIFAASYVPEV